MATIVKKWYFKYYSLLLGEAAMFIHKLSIWNGTREQLIGTLNLALNPVVWREDENDNKGNIMIGFYSD